MKTFTANKVLFPIIAALGLCLVIAWMSGLFSDKIDPSTLPITPDSVQSPLQVSVQTLPRKESIPAGIRARETTIVASRILARIEKIHVRAGDSVSKDQLLVTLENSSLNTQIEQSVARVDSIKALLKEAESNLQRIQKLKKDGLASSSDLDKAQANFSRLNSDLQAVIQSKQLAIAELSYSQILSPIDGRIVDRRAEPGNMATPGEPLLSLYNPHSLLVEANIRESLAVKVSLGQKVLITFDALNKSVQGNISELVPAGDPNARNFLIKADIQFDKALLPGMFARMEIEHGLEEKILIPKDYIHHFGQLNMVWIVENTQLSRRFVRIGTHTQDKIEIISGLSPGDLIALSDK